MCKEPFPSSEIVMKRTTPSDFPSKGGSMKVKESRTASGRSFTTAPNTSPVNTEKEAQQDETQQPSPAALFSGFPVGSDALWRSTLAPAGDGACS
jgi:hypothetical protein